MPGAGSPQAAAGASISLKAVTVAKPKAESKPERKPKNAAFAVEEDTSDNKRKLVKLEYGAEEMAAGGGGGGGGGAAAQAARSAAAAAAMLINKRRGGESAADRAKRLCAQPDTHT
jgi:hypothetical protein